MATDHAETEDIADSLHRLFEGLQAFLASNSTAGQREQMHGQASETFEAYVDTDSAPEAVQEPLGKIEGGLGHWLTFVTEPAVDSTN